MSVKNKQNSSVNLFVRAEFLTAQYILNNVLPGPWKKMLRSYSSTQTFVNTTNFSPSRHTTWNPRVIGVEIGGHVFY